MPCLCSVTPQSGGWVPVELKYGAVRERHIAAERGHCDPAGESGGETSGPAQTALCHICPGYHPKYKTVAWIFGINCHHG